MLMLTLLQFMKLVRKDMSINAIWFDDLACASSVVNIPRTLRKKFAGKRINFRRFCKCKNFFQHRCKPIEVKGEVMPIIELEEFTSARFTYDDNNKCYYFESLEDASWFRLKYGI